MLAENHVVGRGAHMIIATLMNRLDTKEIRITEEERFEYNHARLTVIFDQDDINTLILRLED